MNGLDKTKENLKNFIERWEEHPNSPYVFDTGNHLISPIIDDVKNSNSVLSSRGKQFNVHHSIHLVSFHSNC